MCALFQRYITGGRGRTVRILFGSEACISVNTWSRYEGTYNTCYNAPANGVDWNRLEVDIYFASNQGCKYKSFSVPEPCTNILNMEHFYSHCAMCHAHDLSLPHSHVTWPSSNFSRWDPNLLQDRLQWRRLNQATRYKLLPAYQRVRFPMQHEYSIIWLTYWISCSIMSL